MVFICTAVLLAGKIYGEQMQQPAAQKEITQSPEIEMSEKARLDPTKLPFNTENARTDEQPFAEKWGRLEEALRLNDIPEDPRREVRKAKEANQDIVGILEAGDAVSDFIVQGTDNTFYLTHDPAGAESASGALFLDSRCLLDPRSRNLIIYGHNMRNGTAFGNLKKYRDETYVREHPYITITWEDTRETYEIYAVTDVNVDPGSEDYFKITEWDFASEEGFLAFAQYFASRSFFELPAKIAEGDRMLLLSTCSYTYENGRQIIACRLKTG